MTTIEIVLALLVALAALGSVARWTAIPLPLVLIVGGLLLSFVPGLEQVRIDPDVFFALFIPPLLFSDGWLMPKRDFAAVVRPVLLLAFGLVLATVVVVGYAMHSLIPSLPLAAAFALGAIVSPTDAVATAAMTARLPLPARAIHVLNGESLINDASGLVAFKFALATIATGAFSLGLAAWQLLLVACGGFALGLGVAWAFGALRTGLKRVCIDDPTLQTILSLLTPFAAYFAGEAVHVSSILAIVGAGLYAGWHDARNLSPQTRQHAWEVWGMLLFVFSGLVFMLLGLSLRPATGALLASASWASLASYALALWLIITVIRLAWVYPAAYLPRLLSPKVRAREGWRDPRHVLLVGWAGLRGSVTMAAALSIPAVAASGAPFPGRDLVIFLAAATIVLTLVVNGTTLPVLIRRLHIGADSGHAQELRAAEMAIAQAAAEALTSELPQIARPEDEALARRMIADYQARVARHTANADRRRDLESAVSMRQRLALVAIAAERRELASLRDMEIINDETVREIEMRIDHAELLAAGDSHAGTG